MSADITTSEKVVALYKFLRDMSALRNAAVKSFDKHPWSLMLDEIPAGNDGITLCYRDSYGDEGSEPTSKSILEVSKPDFEPCPPLKPSLEGWLEDGWDYYENRVCIIEKKQKIDPETGEILFVERFEDDPRRTSALSMWTELRDVWVDRQLVIEDTRNLFINLYQLHIDLGRDSETHELMVGTGWLKDREDDTVDHPILLKKVKTSFDAKENIVRVEDVDAPSEVFSLLVRDIPDLNLECLQETERELVEEGYHPLDRTEAPAFLKVLIHKLTSKSEFSVEAHGGFTNPDTRLLLYLRPVLFMRKKIDGTPKAIGRIIEAIDEGVAIPSYLCDIVGDGGVKEPVAVSTLSIEEEIASVGGEAPDILLAKEANREQLDIARKIGQHGAVLVQGPPGTGKTHTIANLMGHLLAQGQSVLVTSHKEKALSVLKDKLPRGLQGLCVALLDDSNTEMERSVDSITECMSRNSASELRAQAKVVAEQREAVIEGLAATRKAIYAALHQEHELIVFAGESISPIDAAKYVKENEARYSNVIPGHVLSGATLPLSEEELQWLYESNKTVTEDVEDELEKDLPAPSELISPSELFVAFEQVKLAQQDISNICLQRNWVLRHGEDQAFFLDTEIGALRIEPKTKAALDSLSRFASQYSDTAEWRIRAAADGKRGSAYRARWTELFGQIEKTKRLSENLLLATFGKDIEAGEADVLAHAEDFAKLKDVLSRKGRVGKLDLILNKGMASVLEAVRINGARISTVEDCDLVWQQALLARERNECEKYWSILMSNYGAPKFTELSPTEPERIAFNWIDDIKRLLDWYATERTRLVTLMELAGLPAAQILRENPLDSEEADVARTLEAINDIIPLLVSICESRIVIRSFTQGVDGTRAVLQSGKRGSSALCREMVDSVEREDTAKYAECFAALSALYDKYVPNRKRRDLLDRLRVVASDWACAIEQRLDSHGEPQPPDDVFEAWKWKQYDLTLREMYSTPLVELQKRAEELSRQYRSLTARLAEKKAWQALLERTENDVDLRQSLQGWKKTIKKLGKGTGKNAARYAAHARAYMGKCQRAVPAWIMPMDKALNSLDPLTNRFDVVIVDEASQSDVSALAVTFMAKKVVIVGDDKQVSPMAVGVEDDKVRALIDMYIKDIVPNYHLYGPKMSLYDVAGTTFQPLMLKEHFRCVPEIIGFSNKLSYDFKIKPLREPGSSNLKPATIAHRVVNGKRDGRRKTNEPEAREIVCLMKACMEQPEYAGKTFGVISLLGNDQAKLIQKLIVEMIDPLEIEARKILCGDSANFQGDERDVVFLSMVDSGDDEGPLRLQREGADESTKKRYNVAVSRARDQLWVVHSLDRANDLKGGDIRKDLLDYVENPNGFLSKISEVDARAESPFERDVARALVTKGFAITQQWEAGAYRIDIVAQDADKKVAIECDGERWHSGESKIREDMERQAILERLGWRFVRIRGSEYYRDPEGAMNRVFSEVENLGVHPGGVQVSAGSKDPVELLNRVRSAADEIRRSGGPEKMPNAERAETIAKALSNTPVLREAVLKAANEAVEGASSVDVKIADNLVKPMCSIKASVKSPQPASPPLQMKLFMETGTHAVEDAAATKRVEREQYIQEPILRDVLSAGLSFVDKRPSSGSLWIIAKENQASVVQSLAEKYGVQFRFSEKGSKATEGRPGWWMRS